MIALQHGFDDEAGPERVVKGADGRWPLAGPNPLIDVRDDVTECVGPAFLMARRQVRIFACAGQHHARVFRHEGVWSIVATNPQLVLLLLIPPQRTGSAVQLDLQPVLMSREDLAHGETALGAVIT